MDLLPGLGEPGLLDELFWFGPPVLQLILGFFFYWLSGKWLKNESKSTRAFTAAGMVVLTDLLLLFISVLGFRTLS